MNTDDFKRCPHCLHGSVGCISCHYTGWMTEDNKPADTVLGENDKWKRFCRREDKKNTKSIPKQKWTSTSS